DAIHHRHVDHLASTGFLRFEHSGHNPKSEVKRTSTKVPDQVKRRYGSFATAPDAIKSASQCNIVDVVAGGLRQGALLSPSSHPSLHQLRISREAFVGSQAQTFHYAGAEALDECIGLCHHT